MPRLYNDLAWLWPIISPPQDYVRETGDLARLMRTHARREVDTVLHLGCGGGHQDWTLKRQFRVTGLDLSPAMLSLARRLNPEVEYVQGDMRSVRLGRRFDAVALFDSVDYLLDAEALRAGFATAFAHLRPGGVLVTFAEQTRESFVQNRTSCSAHAADGVEVALFENDYDPDPGDTVCDMTLIYLIWRGGRQTIEIDRHEYGLFPQALWPECLEAAGFRAAIAGRDGLCEDLAQLPAIFAAVRPPD